MAPPAASSEAPPARSAGDSARQRHRRRIARAVFLVVYGLTVASITRPVDSSDNLWARMSLTFSIVDHHSLMTDPYVPLVQSNDWSHANGHHYSNKAPGPALLAVPVFAAQRAVEKISGGFPDPMTSYRRAAWLGNLFVGVVPSLLALALLWRLFEDRYRFTPRGAFGMTAMAAAASLSLPYTTILFGHQTAAAFLGIGVALTLTEASRPGTPRGGRLFLGALCFGMAVLADYLAALGVIFWTVWLVHRWRHEPGAWAWWIAGGAGPAIVLLAYNAAAFGSPWIGSYSHSVLDPALTQAVQWHAPRLGKLLHLTVGPPRGWFYAVPVYALVPAGIVLAWGKRRQWPELIFAAGIIGVVLLLLSSWNSWWGGEAVGPRYLLWAMPFATLLLVPVAHRIPKAMVVLGQVSAVLILAVTVTDPLVGIKLDPFFGTALPILTGARDTPTITVWSLMGLPPAVAFMAYALIWLTAGIWIDRTLSRQQS